MIGLMTALILIISMSGWIVSADPSPDPDPIIVDPLFPHLRSSRRFSKRKTARRLGQAANPGDKFQDHEWLRSVLLSLKKENMRKHLKHLSSEPNIAGYPRDDEVVDYLRKEWTSYGLEDVKISTFCVLLSFTNISDPNKIYLLDRSNRTVWTSRHNEMYNPKQMILPAYFPYSPQGDVTGDLVFINSGSADDLDLLKQRGISLRGKIVITSFGMLGMVLTKVNFDAEGIIGAIAYIDPKLVAPLGTQPAVVFPNTIYLPESGIQRGLITGKLDDPLSPGYPSLLGSYRRPFDISRDTPGAPSQPIGYGDAKILLQSLGGERVPANWGGAISGVTYRFGSQMNANHRGWKVRMRVNNYVKDTKAKNIIGYIRGAIEPDRYVYIGNHRDAWGYGAVDPFSGTSVILEIIRVLGQLRKSGWRPRRTIVFLSFAAEEPGLIGSAEYAQENENLITTRGVAMLNLDICMEGRNLRNQASPVLQKAVHETLKLIRDPDTNFTRTLLASNRAKNLTFTTIGQGSDHQNFAFYAGLPATFLAFVGPIPGVQFPAYHSRFDTFQLYNSLMDPHARFLRTCGVITTHLALNLAESRHLPFNTEFFVEEVDRAINELDTSSKYALLGEESLRISFQNLKGKIEAFKLSLANFNRRWSDFKADATLNSNELRLREFNDKIMMLDRQFILKEGLPFDRRNERHVLFSPTFQGGALPGIKELTVAINRTPNADQKKAMTEQLKKHISDVMIAFHKAMIWLQD